ncbi:MAG: BlaI/MecI/CopY family transcriptional regulator [Myxococcales bacterium]|nr:BlaI/MecI/CopY family transcriptional regulator [Myxococcales bacterium]
MAAPPELGPLEMRVLGLLGGESLAVGAIRDRLAADGHELAYTTVMTVLVRLHGKGLVDRRKDGNRYVYTAARGAPRASQGILARVGRSLFDRDRTRPILALLDDAELSRDELRDLRSAIDAKLREKKKS